MKTLRKLVLLAILALIGYGALSLWQSPYFALYEIDQGLAAKDPVRVERYVDLEAVVKAAADVTGALAAEEAGVGGGDLGSRILGALVGAITDSVGEAASIKGAMELRKAIQEGRVTKSFGAFVLHDGWKALGGMQKFGTSALVELKSACKGNEASLRVMFEERDGPTMGYPKKWVLVGVDKDSLKLLAKTCRAR